MSIVVAISVDALGAAIHVVWKNLRLVQITGDCDGGWFLAFCG
jgi:uncharacterized membrane protein YcjF (UPF0283 family)